MRRSLVRLSLPFGLFGVSLAVMFGILAGVGTDRELEVFQLLGQGLPVKQIAENLFVSVKTVEAHREHIKQKMNFKSSAELLRYAIEHNRVEG